MSKLKALLGSEWQCVLFLLKPAYIDHENIDIRTVWNTLSSPSSLLLIWHEI